MEPLNSILVKGRVAKVPVIDGDHTLVFVETWHERTDRTLVPVYLHPRHKCSEECAVARHVPAVGRGYPRHAGSRQNSGGVGPRHGVEQCRNDST